MKRKRNLVFAIVLSTAAGILTLQTVFAPAPDSITHPAGVTITSTGTSDPEPCAYIWAYHDAPTLTKNLNKDVQAIDPDASASVQFFGEDCVFADGHSTFGTLETDFYIHLPIENLSDEEALGNWMAQVLPMIIQIPPEEIQGNYGFAEFWFMKNDAEQINVRVPLQQYKDIPQDKTGAELYRLFYIEK